QTLVRHFEACMIVIGTIPAEDVDLEALLERFEIVNSGPHDLPEYLNVALERFGFRHRRREVPRIVTVDRGPWAAALALAMMVCRLNAKSLTDLLERNAVAVNPQVRTEGEVGRVLRLFAAQEATERAKRLWRIGVIHKEDPDCGSCCDPTRPPAVHKGRQRC